MSDSDESMKTNMHEPLYEDDKDLYKNNDPSYNGLVEDEKEKEEYIRKMMEFKLLYQRDKTNDYYLLLYISSILDYTERRAKGCITDKGRALLNHNVNIYIDKIKDCIVDGKYDNDKIKKAPIQKDITRLTLYMVISYALCFLMKGMSDVANEPESVLLDDFPDEFKGDFEELGEKSVNLIPKFKQILDHYTTLLKGEYRKIFMEERNAGFVKPIFATVTTQTNSRPESLKDAIGLDAGGNIIKDDYDLTKYYSNPPLVEEQEVKVESV